jgi:UDP-GlcNAc:undecaprenyl-phosphate GlcNAc-1-phosphate transferase
MAVFMLALLGGLCGFLFYNFNPARVFMGDCGSLFVGFTIASSSVMCLTKSTALVGLALPMLALGIPIFDTFFSMLRRYLDRRSLFAPDRSHFHHRLIDLGLKQRHAVLAIYAVTCGAAGLGLFMMVHRDAGALVLFTGILLLVLLFRVVGAVHFRQTLLRLQQKYAHTTQEHQIQRTFEDLQLRFRQAHDLDQWWQAVCDAGTRFEFDSVSVVTRDQSGQAQTRIWRRPGFSSGDSRIVTINLPIGRHGDHNRNMECRIAMTAEPSLEWAGHKGALFGWLVDECDGMVIDSGTHLMAGISK